MPTARFTSTSGCVVHGKIYAVAGASGYDALSMVEVYDPMTDTWTSETSLPTPRVTSVCAVNSKIYAIGGALTIRPPHPAVSTVEVYDIGSINQPVTPKSIRVIDPE
jgi:hypothetical protein